MMYVIYALLPGIRYCTYAVEIAIITPISEITQNHKGYDAPCLTSSPVENFKCAS